MISTNRPALLLALRALLCIAWGSGVVLSYPLWLPSFLSVAIIPIGTTLTMVLLGAFIVSLCVWTVRPTRIITGIVVACVLLLCAGDISRFQTWTYFYLIAVLVLTQEHTETDISLGPLWILFSFLYLFAGISKLNHSFYSSVVPLLADKGITVVFPFLKPFALAIAKSTPWIEIIAGVGLLFKRTRMWGAVIAAATNLFIFIVLGVLAQGVAPVVWPWNIGLAGMLMLSFLYASPEISTEFSLRNRKYAFMFVVGVLILGKLVGVTAAPFGFALWAGNSPRAEIIVPASAHDALASRISPLYLQTDGTYRMSLEEVAYTASGTNIFPSIRVYRSIFKHICKSTQEHKGMFMVIIYPDLDRNYVRCDSN